MGMMGHLQCREMELKWHRTGVWAPSSFPLPLEASPSAGVIPSCHAGISRNCCWQHLGMFISKCFHVPHNSEPGNGGVEVSPLQTEESIPGLCSAPAEDQEVCPAPCEVKAEGFPGEAPTPPWSIHSAPLRCCYVQVVNYSCSLKE